MKIPVVGFDPSLRYWGVAEGMLDLETGYLDEVDLSLIEPKDPDGGKQVRQNSKDIHLAHTLATTALLKARRAKAVFVEVPVGSKSARAMASYGICVGVLGAIRAEGIPLIEVTPTENKEIFTGDRNATKRMMIEQAAVYYPKAPFPRDRTGKILDKAEHMADALGAIHAGVVTPLFQQILRLNQQV